MSIRSRSASWLVWFLAACLGLAVTAWAADVEVQLGAGDGFEDVGVGKDHEQISLVGVIEEVGPGVIDLERGQRVAAMIQYGGYTEYAILPAEKVVQVPEGVDSESAARSLASINSTTAKSSVPALSSSNF